MLIRKILAPSLATTICIRTYKGSRIRKEIYHFAKEHTALISKICPVALFAVPIISFFSLSFVCIAPNGAGGAIAGFCF